LTLTIGINNSICITIGITIGIIKRVLKREKKRPSKIFFERSFFIFKLWEVYKIALLSLTIGINNSICITIGITIGIIKRGLKVYKRATSQFFL